LVQAGVLFGIAEGAVRTALSRMLAAGEVEWDGGWYCLAGPLLERQHRIDDSTLGHRLAWEGGWELAVVAVERRAAVERAELRAAAAALHFGEVREGVWARPDNLDRARLPGQRAVLEAQCVSFQGARAPRSLAGQLFDLDGWARRAVQLLAALDGGLTCSGPIQPGELADGMMVSAAVFRHLQADPLLPEELLPPDWPGDLLRGEFAQAYAAFMTRLRAWLADTG
jgi:phenylacetic acid degradation operon negative regulatory protein